VAKSIGQFIRAESISRNIKTTIIRHHAPDLSHRRADRMLIFFQVRIRQMATVDTDVRERAQHSIGIRRAKPKYWIRRV
jgi:hypothetical protein